MDRLKHLRDELLATLRAPDVERIALGEAAGRWLAAPALAAVAAPPYDCSAMDGYALRASEVSAPAALPVSGVRYAGDVAGEALAPGTAVRIFTGAPLPPGADAVVREEATSREGDRVLLRQGPRPGENVRLAGEDVTAGGEALPAGVRLGPRQLALCAAVGRAELSVARRPRVCIVTTGDELVRGLAPDSNGVALAGLIRALGAEVEARPVGDEVEAVAGALSAALGAGADAVVTTGGVSIGARDQVPAALAALGADVRVHGVPMKPGKPFLFALAGGRPVLGLPGSPSACLVAFEVFARPALLHLCGAGRLLRRVLQLPAAEPFEGRPGRARFIWATLRDDGLVSPVGRDAAQVRGPALASALVHLPAGEGGRAPGELVETWLLEGDEA